MMFRFYTYTALLVVMGGFFAIVGGKTKLGPLFPMIMHTVNST
jgi:membrane protease YdiL (CAAX protease family)